MNIGLTGASGFIGRRIIALANELKHHVIGFSRRAEKPIPGCLETRSFDLRRTPDLRGCDSIIHLAGETVVGLWTKEKKQRIRDSRVLGTERLVEAMRVSDVPPRVLVSGSAIGFYGDTGETPADEAAPSGSGFLADVVQAWESAAGRARECGARVIFLRTGIVLGSQGGALQAMLPIFRAGLGGKLGSGRQWMSWIHLDDIAALALFAATTESVSGPLNGTAPAPCRNADFTRALAAVLHRPAFLNVPAFLLRALTGEFSRELLDSKRVIPKAAMAAGFTFRHPALEDALRAELTPPVCDVPLVV